MRLKRIITLLCFSILIIGSSIISGVSFENNINTSNKYIYQTGKTVLITGFESWAIYSPNPSQLIAENLSNIEINGAEIVSIIVPVIWGEAVDFITQAIIDYEPDIVISIGTGMINSIHVEKIGKNIKSCREPDNEGRIFLLRRIDPRGPFLRFSNLPIKNIVLDINKAGIPVESTYNAGSFICNEVLYGVLNYIVRNDLSIYSGFIHVPLLYTQDPENGMDLETMMDALEIAISVCLEKL